MARLRIGKTQDHIVTAPRDHARDRCLGQRGFTS
jgi:hypothetical protein